VKKRRTLRHLGSSGHGHKPADGVDATMQHSHISGGHTFSHCHVMCGRMSAEQGEFLGTLLVIAPAGGRCRASWEVVIKVLEQRGR